MQTSGEAELAWLVVASACCVKWLSATRCVNGSNGKCDCLPSRRRETMFLPSMTMGKRDLDSVHQYCSLSDRERETEDTVMLKIDARMEGGGLAAQRRRIRRGQAPSLLTPFWPRQHFKIAI